MTDVAQGGAEGVEETTAAPAEGGVAEGAGSSPDRLLEAFQSFQQETGAQIRALGERIPEQPAVEPEPEDPFAGFEPAFSPEDYDVDGQLTEQAQRAALDQMVQHAAQEAVKPFLAQQAQERRDREADALEQKYPVFADEAKAAQYIGQAQQQAAALGKPELAIEPGFLEMVYLADEARQKSKAEQSATDQAVTLERAGGAAPADGSQGDDGTAGRIAGLAARRFSVGR